MTFRYAFHDGRGADGGQQRGHVQGYFIKTMHDNDGADVLQSLAVVPQKKTRADIQQHGHPQRFSTFRGGTSIIPHPARPRQQLATAANRPQSPLTAYVTP